MGNPTLYQVPPWRWLGIPYLSERNLVSYINLILLSEYKQYKTIFLIKYLGYTSFPLKTNLVDLTDKI